MAEDVRKGSAQVAGPDELAKEISKQGLEFSRRFASGLRYLNRAYLDQVSGKEGDQESWEAAFRDVINDILEKSGMNYENIIEFALKQYKKFLKDNPKEKARIKKHIARMHEKIKAKKEKET